MKERGIIFDGPAVRAILEGRKTQARRVVKPQPDEDGLAFDKLYGGWFDTSANKYRCPFGAPGDRLWCKETWAPVQFVGNGRDLAVPWDGPGGQVAYRADGHELRRCGVQWRPSIQMPRGASRLTLEILNVRVQRVQEISEEDAAAEGLNGWAMESNAVLTCETCRDVFRKFWDSLHGAGAWDRNDWAWAVTFRRITPESTAATEGRA